MHPVSLRHLHATEYNRSKIPTGCLNIRRGPEPGESVPAVAAAYSDSSKSGVHCSCIFGGRKHLVIKFLHCFLHKFHAFPAISLTRSLARTHRQTDRHKRSHSHHARRLPWDRHQISICDGPYKAHIFLPSFPPQLI